MSTEGNNTEETQQEMSLSNETIERAPPLPGGTVIIMQRHGDYDRNSGHLSESGRENSLERSQETIEQMLLQIPEDERDSVYLAVVASPTIKNEGQRSMETGAAVLESAQKIFAQYGIPPEHIMSESPRPMEDIEEPRIFNDRDLRYFFFLREKYGKGTPEFWTSFEHDTHKKEREEFGAEGPLEMSDRYAHAVHVLARYARSFHSKNGDELKRLIIWSVSHYDTITVFMKNHVADIPQTDNVPVGYDGGVSMMISPDNEASIRVGNEVFPVEIPQGGTKLAGQTKKA